MTATTNKIRSRAGFSLTEMLLTVLIMSVALVGITTGIATIQRSYRKITRKSNAMALISTLTTAMGADLKYATDVRTDEDGVVEAFYSTKRNVLMEYGEEEDDDGKYLTIDYLDVENGKTTASTPLVTRSMYADDLTVEMTEPLTYVRDENGNGLFTYEISVLRNGAGSDENALISQNFSVRPFALSERGR